MKKACCALLLTCLVTGCGERDLLKPNGGLERGVLIKSVSVALWLPPMRVPSAQGQSVKLKDLAETLEGPGFGQLQRDDPKKRVRVAVDDEIRERTVSFDLGSDVTVLELLTVIAVEGKCQVIVEDSLIRLKDASAK